MNDLLINEALKKGVYFKSNRSKKLEHSKVKYNCIEDCLTIIDENGNQCGDLRMSGYKRTWSIRKRDLLRK